MKRKKKSASTTTTSQDLKVSQLEGFKSLLSDAEYAALKEEIEKPLPPAIRLNPLKTAQGFADALASRYGWTLSPIPFCSEGYRVDTHDGMAVSATLEHKTGQYYIQEAASMLPVALFTMAGDADDLTLDLAASPGGKTTHLVARQNDRGLVMANDSSQGRIQALKVVLQHWGATNSVVTRFPGEKFGAWFTNVFDRALIDAPCSMQGLRTAESHDERPVTDKESRLLSQRQAALLGSALAAVRIGGQVVYSTCTLMPGEDEGVVETVLEKFRGSVELLDAGKILPVPAPGVQIVNGVEYRQDMKRVVRLWPHRYQTAGFFACLLQKTGEMVGKPAEPPSHSMENAGFVEVSSLETTRFAGEFKSWSGFDLPAYLEMERRVLVRRDQRIFLFPRLLLERFGSLPVQSAGMLMGEWEGDDFIPSHEWVLRFGSQCENIILKLDEGAFTDFCKGDDLFGVEDNADSTSPLRVVMDESCRVAGRGKLAAGQLKNLSARQLR